MSEITRRIQAEIKNCECILEVGLILMSVGFIGIITAVILTKAGILK